jgi:hypothetical protein
MKSAEVLARFADECAIGIKGNGDSCSRAILPVSLASNTLRSISHAPL